MIRVRVVSKPVRPPWTDSSKNLVKDLVRWSASTEYTLMGDATFTPAWPRVRWSKTYSGAGRYAPGLLQNARVFRQLLPPDRAHDIDHYFFAPNPRSCRVLGGIERFRRQSSVHTICSVPRTFEGLERILFADVHVALSDWTRSRLVDVGVADVRYIQPGIDPRALSVDPTSTLADELDVSDRPVVLFAGDYEVGGGAVALVKSLPALSRSVPDAALVLACRIKTPEARAREVEIRRLAQEVGVAPSVVFLNEVDRMGDLLDLATVMAMPIDSTYRKMDVPLVLLEAMALGKPVVVSDVDPVRETVSRGGGIEVPRGDHPALAATLSQLISDELHRERLGADARSAVERYWHIRHAAEQYERLYREIGS